MSDRCRETIRSLLGADRTHQGSRRKKKTAIMAECHPCPERQRNASARIHEHAARFFLARWGTGYGPVGQHPGDRPDQNEHSRQFDERLRDDHGCHESACRRRKRESQG